ncbi:hypothetical protein TCAL_08572 [Tigriopus californicus]|uniref:Scavenger receptor class B member 1 n=1 Tax=Tigriopus californicus TaxID=6832 RepID=A0A553PBL3_TIGCA|nr:protein peste-like [Tigriopus californicus]TRY75075.1 hypothetical protein TCAL_08572 [Tigriopus californicus]|eukprot:TCALIF_08572-PA protein Name:"Similar to SCARB2 Lysosome membrane protein 2 (Homo sapiens)" AED:0.00 eAED:0.00 QI:98/1/1/1/1/1/2/141/549
MRFPCGRLVRLSQYGLAVAFLGLVCLASSLICVFYFEQVEDMVQTALERQTIFMNDSVFLEAWQNPPLTPITKVYVFNVTNQEDVLAGNASRFQIEEIGPFVYSARTIKRVVDWGQDGKTLTFQSKTTYQYLPKESAFPDDRTTFVVVPNVLLMTGMLKTEVRPMSSFIKRNIIWPILTSTGYKTPFLHLSVADFVWGYEDELGCLDSDPSTENEDLEEDLFGDDFVREPAKPKMSERSYRRPDGRCMFGTLVGRNDTWESPIMIQTGLGDIRSKGQLLKSKGKSSFGAWTPNSPCDSLIGTQEPSALPPQLPDTFNLFLGIMCRAIGMEHDGIIQYGQIHAKRYVPVRNSFNFTQDSCYHVKSLHQLPPGALSASTCTDGAPLLVSFPHYEGGSPWYLDQVDGLTPSETELHLPQIDVEPTFGAPLSIKIRFQVSLLLERDSDFPPLTNLTSQQTLLPVFWVEEGFGSPPDRELTILQLGLHLPFYVAVGLPLMVTVTALLLFGFAVLCCTHKTIFEPPTHFVMSKYETVPCEDLTNHHLQSLSPTKS